MTVVNVSSSEYKNDIAVSCGADDSGNKSHFPSIAGRLFDCSQQSSDPLSKSLQPLIDIQLIPTDTLIAVFMKLCVPDLLNMRLISHHFQTIIDENSVLQARIAHFYFERCQLKCNISTEELRCYLDDNKLSVEINNSLCLWKINRDMSKRLSWISHLVVKEANPIDLTTLLNHLTDSKRIAIVYLCNCNFAQECLDALHNFVQVQKNNERALVIYLCNPKTIDCELPSEIDSYFLVHVDEVEGSAYTIEQFLSQESDVIDLNEFESKVSSIDMPAEEVIACAQSLKPWMLLPILSSVWHSAVMKSVDLPVSAQKVQKEGLEFLEKNPHHAAVTAAIRTQQTHLERDSSA